MATPKAKPGTEVAPISAEEQALIASSKAGVDQGDLIIPHLKLVQGTTKGVPDGIHAGEFFNALTGEGYGTSLKFVVAAQRKGRFGTDADDNIIASGFATVNEDGLPWVDDPRAEEQFKAAVNRGDIEWGSGPPVSTTYNFFGYVVGTEVPVRFSMMRSATNVAKKWLTMLQFAPAFWDAQFDLGSTLIEKGKNKYYLPTVVQGAKASAEERQQAVTLAQAVANDAFSAPEDLREREPREEDSGAGLGVA